MDVLSLNLPPQCHISFSYITDSDIAIIHQNIQTICLHAPHCHYYNVDFVSFHIVTKESARRPSQDTSKIMECGHGPSTVV